MGLSHCHIRLGWIMSICYILQSLCCLTIFIKGYVTFWHPQGLGWDYHVVPSGSTTWHFPWPTVDTHLMLNSILLQYLYKIGHSKPFCKHLSGNVFSHHQNTLTNITKFDLRKLYNNLLFTFRKSPCLIITIKRIVITLLYC